MQVFVAHLYSIYETFRYNEIDCPCSVKVEGKSTLFTSETLFHIYTCCPKLM